MSIDPNKKYSEEITKMNNDDLWKVSTKYKMISIILIIFTALAISIVLYLIFSSYFVILYPWVFAIPACYFIITQKKSKYEQGIDVISKYKNVHYDYESKE